MTFAELIAHLRKLGVRDDDEIEAVDLDFGVPGKITVGRDHPAPLFGSRFVVRDGPQPPIRVSIWHEYD